MKTLRILPADVFDALELSALAFGGIGAGAFRDKCGDPLCVSGHRWFLRADDKVATRELGEAFILAGIYADTNDPAVWAINKRAGRSRNARVPFEKWCRAMNVIRGE